MVKQNLYIGVGQNQQKEISLREDSGIRPTLSKLEAIIYTHSWCGPGIPVHVAPSSYALCSCWYRGTCLHGVLHILLLSHSFCLLFCSVPEFWEEGFDEDIVYADVLCIMSGYDYLFSSTSGGGFSDNGWSMLIVYFFNIWERIKCMALQCLIFCHKSIVSPKQLDLSLFGFRIFS